MAAFFDPWTSGKLFFLHQKKDILICILLEQHMKLYIPMIKLEKKDWMELNNVNMR